jgi:hypothetical protein
MHNVQICLGNVYIISIIHVESLGVNGCDGAIMSLIEMALIINVLEKSLKFQDQVTLLLVLLRHCSKHIYSNKLDSFETSGVSFRVERLNLNDTRTLKKGHL